MRAIKQCKICGRVLAGMGDSPEADCCGEAASRDCYRLALTRLESELKEAREECAEYAADEIESTRAAVQLEQTVAEVAREHGWSEAMNCTPWHFLGNELRTTRARLKSMQLTEKAFLDATDSLLQRAKEFVEHSLKIGFHPNRAREFLNDLAALNLKEKADG